MLLKSKFLLFICIITYCYGKTNTLDSLQHALSTTKNDTKKVSILGAIAWEYRADSVQAWNYINEAQKIAQKTKNKSFIFSCYRKSGYLLDYRDQHLAAIEQYQAALKVAKEVNDTLVGTAENDIAISYYLLGVYQKSLEYFFKTLRFNEKTKNEIATAYSLGNIANVFNEQKNHKEAIRYAQKSLSIYTKFNKKVEIALLLNNLATFHDNLKNYEQSIKFYLKALPLTEQFKNKEAVAVCYVNIGSTYEHLGQLDKAKEYISEGLKIAKMINYKMAVRLAINSMGSVLIKQHRYEEAISLIKQVAESTDIKARKEAAFILAQAYQKTNKYQKAYKYYVLYTHLKDSLLNETNQKNMRIIKISYEVDKKEKQNKLLTKKNNLQAKELHINRLQKQVFISLSLLAFVLLFVGGVYLYNYKKTKIADVNKLLNQIKLLKTEIALKKTNKKVCDISFEIDDILLNNIIENRLNKTDLKILKVICNQPTMTNKEIAKQIYLSTEGVRSSLKKMYILFEITAEGRNKKLALALHILKLSSSSPTID